MKKVKQIVSVVLCLLMLVAVVPVMEAKATQSRSYNFNSAEYSSDPGQYMVNIAEAQLGRTGSSLGYSEEWCADFVSDCAVKADQTSAIPAHGVVSGLGNNILNAGGYVVSASNAKPGDIVIIDWDGTGKQNHVELVYSVSGSAVYSIGGNTGVSNANLYSRKVARHSPLSSSVITKIIRPNYQSTVSYTQPPTAPKVSVDKKVNLVNEQVTIRFNAERAANYWVGVYKDNVLWSDDTVYGNTYTVRYEYVGKYDVAVVARNNCGSAEGYASFKYGNKGDYKPSSFVVSSDKSIAYRNEDVKLSFSANDADSYWIGVYTADSYLYKDAVVTGNSYVIQCPWVGNYSIAIVAMNDCASSDTKYIKLSVVEQKEFNISYNANGGKGAPSSQTKAFGKDLFLSSQIPTKSGSTFVKWNTKADGSGTGYNPGATYTGNADLVLYAIWQQNHTHSYTSTITLSATCTATGIRTFTCSCGDSYTETIPVNASNHVNKTNTAATASTCTVKGYTAGVYCNDCRKYVGGHAEQPLAAHQTATQNAKAATCTAEGYTGDQVCTVCKQTITKGSAIAKKAHTLTTVNQKAAGCTTAGYTGDQVCTTCKQTITKGSAINALGHANADSNGNCTRCGTHIKDVTPSQPSNPQPNPNACKYCGQVHSGPFGWLIKFFHSILAIFKR